MKKIKFLLLYSVLGFILLSCQGNITAADIQKSESSEVAIDAPAPPSSDFTALLNNKDWTGSLIFNGALFYAKGLIGAYNEQPHVMLSFQGLGSKDDQLSFTLVGFDGQAGTYQGKKLEAGFFNPTAVFGNRSFEKYSDLTVTISDYKLVNATEATVSGSAQGNFLPSSGQNLSITNGSFKNLKLKIFNEKY